MPGLFTGVLPTYYNALAFGKPSNPAAAKYPYIWNRRRPSQDMEAEANMKGQAPLSGPEPVLPSPVRQPPTPQIPTRPAYDPTKRWSSQAAYNPLPAAATSPPATPEFPENAGLRDALARITAVNENAYQIPEPARAPYIPPAGYGTYNSPWMGSNAPSGIVDQTPQTPFMPGRGRQTAADLAGNANLARSTNAAREAQDAAQQQAAREATGRDIMWGSQSLPRATWGPTTGNPQQTRQDLGRLAAQNRAAMEGAQQGDVTAGSRIGRWQGTGAVPIDQAKFGAYQDRRQGEEARRRHNQFIRANGGNPWEAELNDQATQQARDMALAEQATKERIAWAQALGFGAMTPQGATTPNLPGQSALAQGYNYAMANPVAIPSRNPVGYAVRSSTTQSLPLPGNGTVSPQPITPMTASPAADKLAASYTKVRELAGIGRFGDPNYAQLRSQSALEQAFLGEGFPPPMAKQAAQQLWDEVEEERRRRQYNSPPADSRSPTIPGGSGFGPGIGGI